MMSRQDFDEGVVEAVGWIGGGLETAWFWVRD